MKSELKESDIWLMVYERIWWISFVLFLSYIHVNFFTQTLTSLDLQQNQIGDEGVQYLTDALKNNQVSFFFFLFFSRFDSHFFIQTLNTLILAKNQIEEKGAEYLANVLENNTVNFCLSSSISFTFAFSHKDTHSTWPHWKSNWRQWSPTSC